MTQPKSNLSRRGLARTALANTAAAAIVAPGSVRAADSRSRDGRIIILPSLKQNGGIHAIDMTGQPPDTLAEVISDGYWTPNDGGGGRFRWDPEATEMEDNFLVFAPNPAHGAGRWWRIVDPTTLSFEMAGARGDGATDDFVVCQQMLLIASRQFRQCRVALRSGRAYLLDYSPDAVHHQMTLANQSGGCSLLVPNHCVIEGSGGALGMTASGVPGLDIAARLILHPRMTIRLGYFAELRDLQILRKNMRGPVDHFSPAGPANLEDMQAQIDLWFSEDGTRPGINAGVRSVAITNGGIDTKVRRVLVMGFHTAYLSDGSGRPVVDQLYFDTAGRGVEIARSADDAMVHECYSNAFWSSSLANSSNERGDQVRRPGIAYDFHDKTDGLRCIDCSAAGWAVGLRLSNVWAVTISGLDVEPAGHPPEEVTRGVLAENCVSHTTFINPLIDGFTYKLDFQHRPLAYTQPTGPNNTPGLGQYASASISVIGGSIQGNPNDPPGHRAFRLGPHSSGVVIGAVLAGFPRQPAILVEADVGSWKFMAVNPSFGEHRPLFEFTTDRDRRRVLRFGCDPIDDSKSPQWTIGGNIMLDELPTSPSGLRRGTLWRNGAAINIVL